MKKKGNSKTKKVRAEEGNSEIEEEIKGKKESKEGRILKLEKGKIQSGKKERDIKFKQIKEYKNLAHLGGSRCTDLARCR